MARRLLNLGTEEAKKNYSEAKMVVRRAKNEAWVQSGQELEKDVSANPRRCYARVNGRKNSMNSIHDEKAKCWKMRQMLLRDGRNILKGSLGTRKGLARTCYIVR